MVRERARYLSNDAAWGRRNLAANAAERESVDATVAKVKERGGRAYSGLAAQWGGSFKVGDVPFYAFFSEANIPAVGFLYHSMALTSDVMVRFNQWNPSHYRLFNIHTVVAPVGLTPPLPPFLLPIAQNGRFRVLAAPPSSYFDVVDVVASVKVTRNNFYDINDRWLQSDWVAKRAHLRLDWQDDVSPRIARLAPDDALPPMPPLPPAGAVARRTEEWGGLPGRLGSVPPFRGAFQNDLARQLESLCGREDSSDGDGLARLRGSSVGAGAAHLKDAV